MYGFNEIFKKISSLNYFQKPTLAGRLMPPPPDHYASPHPFSHVGHFFKNSDLQLIQSLNPI